MKYALLLMGISVVGPAAAKETIVLGPGSSYETSDKIISCRGGDHGGGGNLMKFHLCIETSAVYGNWTIYRYLIDSAGKILEEKPASDSFGRELQACLVEAKSRRNIKPLRFIADCSDGNFIIKYDEREIFKRYQSTGASHICEM